METYARIYEGAVAEIFQTDGDITQMFHPDLVWIDVTASKPTPQVGWSATQVDGAWSFSAPAGPSAAQLWAAYQSSAQAALTESDTTVLRCYENAVPMPTAWITYRKALRAIVSASSGDSTQPLPTKPAYPSGT